MEELLQVVKDNPVLYDTSHEYYSRTKHKDELWEQIAKKLNYSNGVAAKEQWQRLRECHREALRRQQKKIGQGATNIRPWTYQKDLEFLMPYMKHRATRAYPGILKHEENEFEEEDTRISDPLSGGETNLETDDATPRKMKKTAITDDVTENSDERTRHRDELCQKLTAHPEKEADLQNDGLYQFFLSMWNITKSLPMKYQRQVRRNVFEAVSQAEENAEYEAQTNSQLPSSSTSNVAYGDMDIKY